MIEFFPFTNHLLIHISFSKILLPLPLIPYLRIFDFHLHFQQLHLQLSIFSCLLYLSERLSHIALKQESFLSIVHRVLMIKWGVFWMHCRIEFGVICLYPVALGVNVLDQGFTLLVVSHSGCHWQVNHLLLTRWRLRFCVSWSRATYFFIGRLNGEGHRGFYRGIIRPLSFKEDVSFLILQNWII